MTKLLTRSSSIHSAQHWTHSSLINSEGGIVLAARSDYTLVDDPSVLRALQSLLSPVHYYSSLTDEPARFLVETINVYYNYSDNRVKVLKN
jgi:hypothetical protein